MSILDRLGEWLAVWYDPTQQAAKEARTEAARQAAIASRKTTEATRETIRVTNTELVRQSAARAGGRLTRR